MYAPFGHHPITGQQLSDKSKGAAGLLSIFLGYLGTGRFYAGNIGLAWIWPLVDGIVLLTGNPRDGQGRLLR